MDKRRACVAAVALLLVFAGCGGGSDSSQGEGPPAKDTVVIEDIAFKPKELQVEVGATVTWRFEDKGISHDVKAEDESFVSEVMDSGTFEHTFEEPGSFPYICSLHPAMKGTVVVR